MKALTLRQPWASLVALGVKTIETRGWSTSYRGPLAIHAAATVTGLRSIEFDYEDGWAVGQLDGDERRSYCWQRIDGEMRVQLYDNGDGPHPLPLGAVVATCTLVDVVPIVGCDQVFNGRRLPVGGFVVDTRNMGGCLCLVTTENRPGGEDIEDQRPYGDFSPGRYAWLLADIEPLAEPVPAKGRQGLWEWTP